MEQDTSIHSPRPSLPQDDPQVQQALREQALINQQALYQWNDHSLNLSQVPLALKVPSQDEPTLEWKGLVAVAVAKVSVNLLAVLADLPLSEENQQKCDQLQQSYQRLSPVIEQLKQHNISGYQSEPLSLWQTFTHFFHHEEADVKKIVGNIKQFAWHEVEKSHHLMQDILQTLESDLSQSASSLDDYKKLFNTLALPLIANNIKEDTHFTYLHIAGPNPMLFQYIASIPDNCSLSHDDIVHLLFAGDTLAAALADHRVYLCDYQALETLSEHTGETLSRAKYLSAPMAFFILTPDRQTLLPVAIQLGQDAKLSRLVVPQAVTQQGGEQETDYAWQQAKSVVNDADGNYHELIVHLGRTHLVEEAFTVATHRQLAPQHPINRLLLPHFEGTLFINAAAQSSLIAAKGPIDRIFAGKIQATQNTAIDYRLSFDFQAGMLPNELEKRGVNQRELLPFFPYRDDATRVWGAINQWAADYIALYYNSDQDVLKDTELQAWHEELSHAGKIDNIPALKDKESLRDVLTMIMFTASAQHAAVNFPQKSLMSFAPAITGAQWREISLPATDNVQWLNGMPPLVLALEQQVVLTLLGSVYYRPLGEYKENTFPYAAWFKDERVTKKGGPLAQFNDNLKQVEVHIKQDISQRQHVFPDLAPYDYLLSSKIPMSINI
ncbi:lipoxygenase family protein [uncultured Shewanella sp.]|uniref:lipoxygenase family protein n=1 Tax=uncultured Shewanella sp. TaxID=173975 RepID=UPI0026378C55|nr:lipoxygenase family protein [uncultured Shewanella sp.]